jgi:hypothetical protein
MIHWQYSCEHGENSICGCRDQQNEKNAKGSQPAAWSALPELHQPEPVTAARDDDGGKPPHITIKADAWKNVWARGVHTLQYLLSPPERGITATGLNMNDTRERRFEAADDFAERGFEAGDDFAEKKSCTMRTAFGVLRKETH